MNNFLLIQRSNLLVKNILLLLFVMFSSLSFSQTTIITPSTVGGFETGTTFATNGWTTVGGAATENVWYNGTGATAGFTGSRCAYISNTAGGAHAYTISTARASFLYRNVTIPAGESDITLSFSWLGQGESSYDKMRVWIVPTSYTPTSGTAITATGTAPTGRIQAGVTNYSVQGAWTSTSFKLPTAYVGTTVRLVFEWTNDGSIGTQPPTAIDNISLTSAVLVPPTNDNCAGAIGLTVNPTRTCTSTTSGTILNATDSGVTSSCFGTDDDDVWYSFVATTTTHYIELLNVAGSATDLYHAVYSGACGGLGAAILCSDPNTSTVTGLTIGNTYYLQIYSYTSTTGQNTTFDVCVSRDPPCTTPAAQASGFSAGTITSTAFPATFTGAANGYLVIRSTSATPPTQPVNGVVYTAGNIGTLGAGLTFLQSGASTSIAGTGLSGNTRYYYYIYAYNNTSCSGGPLYNTSGPLIGNGVTCPATPTPVSTSSTFTSINFSWPSSIGGGINAVAYELQVTTNAGYTANVAGSPFTINDPTTTYNLTGLTANTTYYYRIRANNGCWSTYTTGTAITGYCAYTTSSSSYWISNFNTTGGTTNINRTSTYTAGGYANYSASDIVSQIAGNAFNFSVTMSSSTHGINIYVDWNNDLDFNDAGELAYASGGYVSATTGTITIPVSASTGNHRMRVVSNYFSLSPSACGSDTYTEAEDYTVNVLPLPACSGTPSGGTVTTSPNSAWPGSPYTVSATGFTYASNLTYQWQSSTDSGVTWANTGASTSTYANYAATAPASGDVHWQLVITCTNSGQSAISSTGIFVTMAVSNVVTGCPNVVSGGLGLSGADPAVITCISPSGCVDLEATYLNLGDTSSYIVEPIAYNPPFAFSGLANPVSVNTDDVWSPVVNLPFAFCFYGNTYTSCVIGSNGILSFDTSNTGGTGYSFSNNLPSTVGALFANSIYGVYHDINPGVGGEVGWELITLSTGCRALVASWSNVPLYGDNTQFYTGMMVLYENSNIIEVYIQNKPNDPGNWNDNNAIVGIQNAAATVATVAPGRNGLDADWTATNEAWRFVPNGTSIASIKWYEGSGVSGTVVGTTDVINVCPANTTIYTAEITYALCNSTTLTVTDETTVTVNKDKTWDGSTSTDWNTANNWTPAGVPLITESVFIPNVANDPIIGAGADALACSLNVETGAVLTLNSGRNMTVTNAITVAVGGTFNVMNSANLVQVNDASINSGQINMERITNVRLQDYSYWSSPVGNLGAGTFPVQNVSPLTPAGFIFEWQTTSVNANGGEGNWVNTAANMIPAKGYILRAPNGFSNAAASALTANFIGVPNNGVFSPTIYRGNDYTTPGTQAIPRTITDDNWNLIGNPYPSALGVNEFLTLPANNSIVGGLRVWTHGLLPTNIVDPFYQDFSTNYYPSDYVIINLTGATSGPGDPTIGAGQSFMVLMDAGAAGSGNVTFNNSMRGAGFTNNIFYRNSTTSNATNTVEQNRIWLDLVAPTGAVNRMLVGYVTDATQAEDRLYDSFTDYKPSQNFYSLIGNEPMAIQGRALPFVDSDLVNLGVTIPQNGIYSIAISALDGLFETTNQTIYIEDLENNIIHNLKQNPYSFTAVAGNITNRFILRYTESRLGNDDLEDLANNVFVVTNDNLSIKSTSIAIKSVTIHDVLGRIISNKNNVNSNEVSFGNIQKNNTTLLVKIELTNGTIVNKKVIY